MFEASGISGLICRHKKIFLNSFLNLKIFSIKLSFSLIYSLLFVYRLYIKCRRVEHSGLEPLTSTLPVLRSSQMS